MYHVAAIILRIEFADTVSSKLLCGIVQGIDVFCGDVALGWRSSVLDLIQVGCGGGDIAGSLEIVHVRFLSFR